MKKYGLFFALVLLSAAFIIRRYLHIPDFIIGSLQGFAFGILIVLIIKISRKQNAS
jgi:uncharacterized membrane protein YdjX (TVP38/TMEM64 family)